MAFAISEYTTMTLIVAPKVLKQIAEMPKADAARLIKRLKDIAAAPEVRHPSVTALVGEPGVFRVRQGDWRAVIAIEDGDVIVDRVMHRREVYR
jgi:mRNA interferase RelE/StbE